MVSKSAAGRGLKVANSGRAGEEIFESDPSFRHVPRIVQVAKPFTAIESLARA
ncbi:hypothetical protein [Desulfosoma caldarium]|uniref:hypothetical protein n=1 Tax=Desulfosoma caldarium TaxID=610254 RepID=UPI0014744B08|nr:hypothetical protein [Desulfosoma caldarium]